MQFSILFLFLLLIAPPLEAKQGCCSYHRGVCGSRCCDGTPLSPACRGSGSSYSTSVEKSSSYSYSTPRSGGIGPTAPVGPFYPHLVPNDAPKYTRKPFVFKIIDGYTFKLSTGEIIRLIGIDTPEFSKNPKAVKYSQRSSSNLTKVTSMGKSTTMVLRTLLEGKQVRIEHDAEIKDKYGRTLGYVFIDTGIAADSPEGTVLKKSFDMQNYSYVIREGKISVFVNTTMVNLGYASPITIPPNVKYAELFKQLYAKSRKHNRGLWK